MPSHSILLIEDERLLALVFEDVLCECGYRVRVAIDGHAGLAAIAGPTLFHALVTDIRLPGPDGWALARHAREANPEVAVVYMTGDSAANHAREGVPNSVILPKPFLPDALVSAVSSSLAL